MWFKKVYQAVNTRKGCFIIGTLFGLFTGLSRGVISINQGEPVIVAFLYGILFSIMWATPMFVGGIMRYPKSKGKKTP